MINFIIHEKQKEIYNSYEIIILNFIGIREEQFKIYKLNEYKTNEKNKDIYIISTNSIDKAILLASKIREKGNWKSQIIIISNLKNIDTKKMNNNLLILKYIDNSDNIMDRLKETLYIAYKILTKEKSLKFVYNKEINSILYDNILFIEKNNNQNYCIIHTTEKEYITKSTIIHLEEILDSAYFMKTHRSCIVNLHNIKYYNYTTNIISFKKSNKKTDLIARDKRKILKSRLIKNKIKNKKTSE